MIFNLRRFPISIGRSRGRLYGRNKGLILRISGLPAETFKSISRKAWEYVRVNHTRERFAEEFRKVIEQIREDRQQLGKNETEDMSSPIRDFYDSVFF